MADTTKNTLIQRTSDTLTIADGGSLIADAGSTIDLSAGDVTMPANFVDGDIVLGEGKNIQVGSTTGSQIAENATDKIAFFGATPIVRPSGATQAAASQTQTALTDSTGGSATTTLAAVTTFTPSVAWNGSSVYPSAADATAIAAAITSLKNSVASIAAELALVKTDNAALVAEANALRTALVNLGLIKGSA